jgi:hypothetical protein
MEKRDASHKRHLPTMPATADALMSEIPALRQVVRKNPQDLIEK